MIRKKCLYQVLLLRIILRLLKEQDLLKALPIQKQQKMCFQKGDLKCPAQNIVLREGSQLCLFGDSNQPASALGLPSCLRASAPRLALMFGDESRYRKKTKQQQNRILSLGAKLKSYEALSFSPVPPYQCINPSF